jgi:hypothetical protein
MLTLRRRGIGRVAAALLLACVCGRFAESLARAQGGSAVSVVTVDDEATGYGTFQSHNQKVVSTPHGIFMTYAKTPFEGATWRVMRSVDGGRTFETIWEAVNTTHPPALEAAADGTLYLVHGDQATRAAYFYRLSVLTSFTPELLAVLDGAHAQTFSLLLDEARGRLSYAGYLRSGTRFVTLDVRGTVLADYMLTGNEQTARPSYPRIVASDGILYLAWSSDWIGSRLPNAPNYYSIHVVRSPDGGVTWQNLAGTPLTPPFVGDTGGETTEVTHRSERPCSTWLGAFAVTRGRAHFAYKIDADKGDLRCELESSMRYQRFDVAGGIREADVSGFAPADVPVDSRDGFFATSPRDGTLFFAGRTTENRIAIVASADDGRTWMRASETEPLTDNLYAIGGERRVTAGGRLLGSFTHDVVPAAVRFFQATVTPAPTSPAGSRLPATATSSAEAAGYPIGNAIDGDDGTVWIANLTPVASNNHVWLQLDLGGTKYVSRLRFTTANSTIDAPYPAHGPSDYRVEASIDGTTWRPIAGVSVPNGNTGSGDHIVDGAARYLRLTTTRINDGTGWALGLRELWAEGGDYPAPGGSRLPAGVTASAAAHGYPPDNAADGDHSSQWIASLAPAVANNHAWVQLDLGRVTRVTRLRWMGAAGSPYPAHAPADYTIETSIDGQNYTRAVSRANAAGVVVGDEILDRNARFIRLATTKVNDGTGWSLSFHEPWAE